MKLYDFLLSITLEDNSSSLEHLLNYGISSNVLLDLLKLIQCENNNQEYEEYKLNNNLLWDKILKDSFELNQLSNNDKNVNIISSPVLLSLNNLPDDLLEKEIFINYKQLLSIIKLNYNNFNLKNIGTVELLKILTQNNDEFLINYKEINQITSNDIQKIIGNILNNDEIEIENEFPELDYLFQDNSIQIPLIPKIVIPERDLSEEEWNIFFDSYILLNDLSKNIHNIRVSNNLINSMNNFVNVCNSFISEENINNQIFIKKMEEIYYSLDITYSSLLNNLNNNEINNSNNVEKSEENNEVEINTNSYDLIPIPPELINDPNWVDKVDIMKIDPDSLTLKQRKEFNQKKYEIEKKQRYEQYIVKESTFSTSAIASNFVHNESNDTSSSSPKPEVNKNRFSVKDRFELAKKEQQEREEQRLLSIKNQKGVIVTQSSFSNTRSAWKDGELFASPANTSGEAINISPANMETKGKLRNMWQNALDNTKTTEQNRYENTKQATIAQFRLTDGSGMVKKRIDEWEELVLQIQASAEMLAEFVRHAQMVSMRVAEKANNPQNNSTNQKFRFTDKSNNSEENTTANEWWNIETKSHNELLKIREDFLNDCLLPELFVLNDTHIYSLQVLEAAIRSSLRRSLSEAKIDHLALRCGVYSSHSYNGLAPIDVFAAVIRTSEGKEYISVSIKANEEFLPADGRLRPAQKELLKEIYGVYKIVISMNNSTNTDNIIEKLIKVVPMPGWESLIEGYLGPIAYNGDEELPKEENNLGEINNSEENQIVGETLYFDDEEEIVLDSTNEVNNENNTKENNNEEQDLEDILNEQLYKKDENDNIDNDMKDSEIVDNSTIIDNDDEKTNGLDESRESYASSTGSYDPNGIWDTKITPPPTNVKAANIYNNPSIENDDISPIRDFSDNEGFFDDDEDDGDEENEEEQEKRINQLQNESELFTEDMSLPSVTNSKIFLPENEILNTTDTQLKKFSWSLEDERSENLPKATHSNIFLNLASAINSQSSYNTFVIQNQDSSMLFTGTLKHATTTSTYMLVNGERVFEYIRGAAASGWLIKFPMKSQKFGRQRTRFFVLRDHILSYHPNKPQSEQFVMMDRFSNNTLHLTSDSTISFGRKLLYKCITITTPHDTLWIKHNQYNKDIAKWMSELNNSIQYLSRPRFFATKPRIESKWYHESPHFTLRYMDSVISNLPVVNLFRTPSQDDLEPTTINERYCKVALFSLRIPEEKNSDSSEEIKTQFNDNIVYKEIRHSIDISNSDCARLQMDILNENEKSFTYCDLNIIKIYGDVVLLGGNKGFLGYGIISRTSTRKNPNKATEDSVNPILRKVLFCIPCDDVLRDPDELDDNEENKELFSTTLGIPYPHAEDSKITAIGISEISSIFVCADNQGIISLWHLPRNKDICAFSPTTATVSSTTWRKVALRLKPECIAAVNINVINSSSNTNTSSVINFNENSNEPYETITSLKFCCHDTYLIVATNRRLILISMQFTNTFTDKYAFYDNNSTNRARSSSICSIANFGSNKRLSISSNNSPFNLNSGNMCITGFNGYTILDKAIPGKLAIFDLYIKEASQPGLAPETIVEWKILESDEIEAKKNSSSWFSRNNTENSNSTISGLSKCTVSRIEWSIEMFQTVLDKLKPFPTFM